MERRIFTSWHGKVGLAVFILSIVAPLGGVVSFRRLGLLQRLPEKMQPQIKWAHRNVSRAARCGRTTLHDPPKEHPEDVLAATEDLRSLAGLFDLLWDAT